MKAIMKEIHNTTSFQKVTYKNDKENYERNKSNYLENIGKYHFFRQMWLVLGVKLMEMSSNLFSRYRDHDGFTGIQCNCHRRERNLRSHQCRPQRVVKWCFLAGSDSLTDNAILLSFHSPLNWSLVGMTCLVGWYQR